MNKHTTTKHQHQPVAHPHRKVHKSFGGLLVAVWIMVIVLTGFASIDYFHHHQHLSIDRSGINLTVTAVNYDDVGPSPFNAPPGWKFVLVDVTVTNGTSKVFNFAPVVQTYISDDSGTRYTMSPTILTNPIAAGPIQPSGSNTGTLSYLVPIHAKNISFQFQP